MTNIVFANFVHRSNFLTRYCPIVHAKFSGCERRFADDSKKKKQKQSDLYETLGVHRTATHNEVKQAYYDLSFKYHPDRNEHSDEAATKFREVSEAYEVLGNFSMRKKYDRGVPISREKKIVQSDVGHKSQYQEFFDSRYANQNTDQSDRRSQEIDDLGSFSNKQREREEALKRAEEAYKNAYGAQLLVGIVLAIVIISCRTT